MPNSRLGSHSSAVSSPIANAFACSASTAASGTAMDETWSPNREMADAPQYRLNTTSRNSGGTRTPNVFVRDAVAVSAAASLSALTASSVRRGRPSSGT
jgi:hypothetical protein